MDIIYPYLKIKIKDIYINKMKKLYKNNGIIQHNEIPCKTCMNKKSCNYMLCKELHDFSVKLLIKQGEGENYDRYGRKQ